MAEQMTKCECCQQPLGPYGEGGQTIEPISKEFEERLHKSYEVVHIFADRKSYYAHNIVCVVCLESACPKCDHRGHVLKRLKPL